MRFQAGETIGAYKILGVLGSGGAGRVYQVEHAVTGRVEAMKVLLEQTAVGDELAQRFLREVRVQASMNHPNIASVYNAFCERGVLVMVMEWVRGRPLRIILDNGRVPASTAVDYLCQVLSALSYSHQRGVIHRDVTPANILIDDSGKAILTDFGLARSQTDQGLTNPGILMGSLHYMAPEQVRGLASVDHRADIYSAGAVLYEALTGRKPFEAEDSFELMRAQVEDEPKPPTELASRTPEKLNAAVLRAMAKRPEERFATAEEFLDTLLSVDGQRTSRHLWPRVSAWRHNHLRRRAIRALIVVALVTATAFLAHRGYRMVRVLNEPLPPVLAEHVLRPPAVPENALTPPSVTQRPISASQSKSGVKRRLKGIVRRLNPFSWRKQHPSSRAVDTPER